MSNGYRPIEDYAIIGNMRTAALVSGDGSIDWLCLPHFDHPAFFCKILDVKRGGFWSIRPEAELTGSSRRYRPGSAVLETTFETAGGRLRLTDMMPLVAPPDAVSSPIPSDRVRVIRKIEALDGPVTVALRARFSFDFTATPALVEARPGRGATITDGADRELRLRWAGSMTVGPDGVVHGALTVLPGEPALSVLTGSDEAVDLAPGVEDDAAGEIEATDQMWSTWSRALQIAGPYREEMLRSALTLKLLTFRPTGAIVAAATTSLPEDIGSGRNWDYRYCWLRDATFTLYALLLVGDIASADAFWGWVERVCTADGPESLQIMYGLHGEKRLTERTLDHLSGYRDSRPVRIGNGAWDQRQIDVYGELIDGFWFYHHWMRTHGRVLEVRDDVWRLICGTADYICTIWRDTDQGIWEIRGEPRHFVYSKVMCWVGLDRAIQFAALHEPGRDTGRWQREREAIRADVLEHGWSETAGAFTMAYGTDELDAANLRMPLVGFLPADDPRMAATIDAIQADLGAGGLILRYRAEDGLEGGEGAFSICSFWLVDCLTAMGRIDEARDLFDRMLGYANDLGLYAEQVDPGSGAALGNFPQAFTHLALIDAGIDLSAALSQDQPVSGDMPTRATRAQHGLDLATMIGGMPDLPAGGPTRSAGTA
ncbi:MAG: glycoside hydrolase family 15 protein [Chloroflexia bacterium]|nr:glycoside hydrolase family 15 protein [Chloroflexia bacterium]